MPHVVPKDIPELVAVAVAVAPFNDWDSVTDPSAPSSARSSTMSPTAGPAAKVAVTVVPVRLMCCMVYAPELLNTMVRGLELFDVPICHIRLVVPLAAVPDSINRTYTVMA